MENESNLKSIPFEVPITINIEGRARIVIPILGERLKSSSSKYQDDEINRLIAQAENGTDEEKPERKILKMAIYAEDIKMYHQMTLPGVTDHMTGVHLDNGNEVWCMLDFDEFDKVMNQIDDMVGDKLVLDASE